MIVGYPEIREVKSKKGKLWYITEIDGVTWASARQKDIEVLLSGSHKIEKINDPTVGQWQFFKIGEHRPTGKASSQTVGTMAVSDMLSEIRRLTAEIEESLRMSVQESMSD